MIDYGNGPRMEMMVVYFRFPGEKTPWSNSESRTEGWEALSSDADLRYWVLSNWLMFFFLAVLISYCSICLNVLVCYFSKITLGILELTEPYNKMVVRIVVMERATRAGTAERSIQKQHQLRITRTTAGIKVAVMKYDTRLLKVKNACRLVKDPLFTDKKTNASLCM